MTRVYRCAVLGSLVLIGCSDLHRSPAVVASPPQVQVQLARVEAPTVETTHAPPPSILAPSSAPASLAPTWAVIYKRYFGPNSDGSCGRSQACHANAMADSASAYAWLAEWGYIAGTKSPLVSRTNSCLRWFGGNMPPRVGNLPLSLTPNDAAVRDLTAWVAAGAASN